ncbi:DUF58 domain-containing protein [Mycolicibacterium wolinskyi]|uniref:DUF58 domain-containing protein n=1 Tax=Mycolicibacterium wolinskyi TaxID=59750 RepID=A0A1X2F8M8_9MYCO|nr:MULTISPECIES: DUF58 domain-containing protein [Mycolicibacterium]MCV7286466.1 DUF58 domain-containing protein [Mycolicibacterium wolinskyi]MCV7293446.1 DUF58 domain-containing protein [Mycolicibacterium goodii]ORX14803.1 hypothetical protein AWC31_26970 [Mycolicibacterium wolinskyi]
MGKYLNRAKQYFGTDARGLLEGGRYALLHTRTLELDDLRPYVAGDDVRDIDWKASARAGSVLIKRFVSERHHKILLVADAGRNMSALTPAGEVKREVATNVMGAIGLIATGRSDEVGMVYGDSRGSANIRNRRGETHIESMLEHYYGHSFGDVGPTDIVSQLEFVARAHRRRLLLIVVSDEPDISPRLDEVLKQLVGQHEMIWLMVTDMPAVGADDGEHDGFDVATGRFVLNGATLGPRVVAAYRAAEQARVAQLDDFLASHEISFARIGSSVEIRDRIVEMNEVFSNAVR